MKKIGNKTTLFMGLLFIVLSFGCIAGVLYQFFIDYQGASKEMADMKEKIVVLDADKSVAEQKVREFSKRVGQEIEMDKFLAAAEAKYGDKESQRKEGDLWINRVSGEWMVTLGAMNGVKKGTRMRVFDRDAQIGVVVADTVLDVVSYVYSLEDSDRFSEGIYKVALE
ncbi:MAG: hypothetical protein AB1650_03685 [Candidatus Omnitrophota bacterium]